MAKHQRYEILAAIENEEYEKLVDFISNEQLRYKIIAREKLEEFEEECIAQALIESTQIDLPYELVVKLLQKIKDVAYIENYINHTRIFRSDEIDIIISTKNIEFIKKRAQYEELTRGFSSYLAKLVMATNDIEYIKEHIEKNKQSYDAKVLQELIIFTNDKKYIKEFINNEENKIELKALLIAEIKDAKYIKQYIKDNVANLNLKTKLSLIKASRDNEYIKECIYDENLLLDSFAKTYLIEYIAEENYTKKCIDDEKLNLSYHHRVELLKTIRDEAYIYDVLKYNKFELEQKDKEDLIKSHNIHFIKRCIFSSELNLDELLKISLILFIGNMDFNFVKECLQNSSLFLSRKGILKLVRNIDDEEYITKVVNGELFELDMMEKITLIKTQSDHYIYEWLIDKKINFSANDIEILISNIKSETVKRQILYNNDLDICLEWRIRFALESKDKEMIDRYLKLYPELSALTGDNIDYENVNKTIKLPEGMTIGIEIESEGKASEIIENEFNYMEWNCTSDGSLIDGIEIVSSILSPTIEDSKSIYLVTKMLSLVGQCVSERCGGHIHIGAHSLKSKQAWANFLEIWCNSEKILYAISNKEGTSPRQKVVKYAAPITPRVQNALDSGIVSLENEEELNQFIIDLKNIQLSDSSEMDIMGMTSDYDRYYALNLCNLDSRLNTIEFRLPNGTLEPELWIENINLFGGLVAVSQELAELQKLENISHEQQSKIEMFEKLKTEISDVEKLEILIGLLGVESEGYRKRFNANIKLLENDMVLTEKLSVEKPVIVKKKPVITISEIEETIKGIDLAQANEVIRNIRYVRIGKNSIERD